MYSERMAYRNLIVISDGDMNPVRQSMNRLVKAVQLGGGILDGLPLARGGKRLSDLSDLVSAAAEVETVVVGSNTWGLTAVSGSVADHGSLKEKIRWL
jgi:hypothetical protein